MKKYLCLAYLALVSLSGMSSSEAETVLTDATSLTLRWSRNREPDIAGYAVYWGRVSGVYKRLDAVTETSATVSVPSGSVFYFAVTAINDAGLESPFSDEVRWPVR